MRYRAEVKTFIFSSTFRPYGEGTLLAYALAFACLFMQPSSINEPVENWQMKNDKRGEGKKRKNYAYYGVEREHGSLDNDEINERRKIYARHVPAFSSNGLLREHRFNWSALSKAESVPFSYFKTPSAPCLRWKSTSLSPPCEQTRFTEQVNYPVKNTMEDRPQCCANTRQRTESKRVSITVGNRYVCQDYGDMYGTVCTFRAQCIRLLLRIRTIVTIVMRHRCKRQITK